MMKTIRYQRTEKMLPREGFTYSTTYLKQTLPQRAELCRHIRMVVKEIAEVLDQDPQWESFVNQPLKGFKTTQGYNRTTMDILTDMLAEAGGKQRNNMPKDFAMAPIERWNKLFADTDYAIELVQTFDRSNNFANIMEFADDKIQL